MRFLTRYGVALLAAAVFFTVASTVEAAEKVVIYCSPQIEYCQIVATEFEKATGIEASMVRKSTGESFAQIKAEQKNPKGDIWWGGTGDPHLQAAEEGLTVPYVSPIRSQLLDWALRPAKLSGDRTVGIYAGALGFVFNSDLLA